VVLLDKVDKPRRKENLALLPRQSPYKAPKVLFQGPDLNANPLFKTLIGLSIIFSGSANLNRGLEEGGAVDFYFAVDFSAKAIHRQRPNA
jgi:DNA (cytosine-5)-methyltransferase 1